MIVSFDFDETLVNLDGSPCESMIKHMRELVKSGAECIIVTGRDDTEDEPNWKPLPGYQADIKVRNFVEKHNLPVKEVYFTEVCIYGVRKGPYLKDLGVTMHHDDNKSDCLSAQENGVTAYLVKEGNLIHVYHA